ncbi:hypothetical protein [Luteimonas saliphila]|uniref:hypothetical protein n=1 Tax=Luteimonas saliphila TaxID=2804919 RepID=UPI00192D8A91|nr:hypothetical protein [Luteimonas saliphila]
MDARRYPSFQRYGVVGLGFLLAGCVVNPYVRSDMPRDGERYYGVCGDIGKNRKNEDFALDFAECTRRNMADKAGRYAMMNNAGGATLLQIAGLAGYSGIRGGNQAQVTALTTGGASLYGAQQYLYRKPREAIYWSGSEAIGCAIGVTRRKILISDELKKLPDLNTAEEFDRARIGEAEARVQVGSLENCGQVKDDVESLMELVDSVATADKYKFAKREQDVAERRSMLALSAASAAGDLTTATTAIADAVNGQLSREQPDPSELAKLLAALKPSTPSTAPAADDSADGDPDAGTAAALLINGIIPLVDRVREAPKPSCKVNAAKVIAYRQASGRFLLAGAAYDRSLRNAEAHLSALESLSGGNGSANKVSFCTLGRANTLLPFGLQLAQQGTQKIELGKTLSIPITGGIPPYSVVAVSSSDSGIGASIGSTDIGGYKVEVSAAAPAKASSKATFFANDAVGAGTMFSVEVAK